jgi:hypothetical protein
MCLAISLLTQLLLTRCPKPLRAAWDEKAVMGMRKEMGGQNGDSTLWLFSVAMELTII